MKKQIIDFGKALLIALVIASIVRTFFFEVYAIPSGSMKPTLMEHDYIFVSKYDYGFSDKSIWPPIGFDLSDKRILSKPPTRGDVVVFKTPDSPNTVFYIKRLIGLPGDKIQLSDGIIYINDQAIEQKDDGTFEDRNGKVYSRYTESFYENEKHSILNDTQYSLMDDFGPVLVPENHYFFMGDNRDHSNDSRMDIGMVHEKYLVAKYRFILLSFTDSILKFWKWHKTFVFDRSLGRAS